MALTLISEQSTPLESYTNAVWRVYSDNPLTEKVQGSFIGANGDLVAKPIQFAVQPSFGSSGFFDFDLMEYYRDNLTFDILDPNTATNAYPANNSFFLLGGFAFTELVNTNGQLVPADTIPLTSTSKIVVNAARQTYNPAGLVGYVMDTSVSGLEKFLTNSPGTLEISNTESYSLSVYSVSSSINCVLVNFRDANGTTIVSERISYSQTGRYDIPVGLPSIAAAGVTIPSNATSYQITIGNLTGINFTAHSETIIFNIVKRCDPIRVHFLNRWGGFDSYTFRFEREAATNSTQFQKYLANGFTPKDRGRQTQYKETNITYTLFSGILSEAGGLWLEEFLGSPVAFIQEGNQLIPITVNDATKVTQSQDLFELKIEVTLANSIRGQRL
jgi:hypothetical protein